MDEDAEETRETRLVSELVSKLQAVVQFENIGPLGISALLVAAAQEAAGELPRDVFCAVAGQAWDKVARHAQKRGKA